ncbi:MAG: hypothetical protein H0T46_16190 [Deltaproteobacteria bacterium]|nr:hypothetical protein [Deltaproteobacteria bacterium]
MTRILLWIPLATIIGLAISLAILLARPPANVVVLTIVTPSAPAPAIVPGMWNTCTWWGYSPVAYPRWCR